MSFHSPLFCYNVYEIPQELNSHLGQVAYGKIGFIICYFAKFTNPTDNIKWGLTVHSLLNLIPTTVSYGADSSPAHILNWDSGVKIPYTWLQSQEVAEPVVKPRAVWQQSPAS